MPTLVLIPLKSIRKKQDTLQRSDLLAKNLNNYIFAKNQDFHQFCHLGSVMLLRFIKKNVKQKTASFVYFKIKNIFLPEFLLDNVWVAISSKSNKLCHTCPSLS